MTKNRMLVLVFISLIILIGTVFILFSGFLKPKLSGILVKSNYPASLYINGNFVGKTTYKGTFEPGQINLKLVPEGDGQKLPAFETKINLVSGIQTVVEREFAATEDESSGTVINFDRMDGSGAGLVVVSTPDIAEVWIDGIKQGVTPYNFNSITTGPHEVSIKAEGFKNRTLRIQTVSGLKLTIFAKLGINSEENAIDPTPSPTIQAKGSVVIGNTPTGFLRMRTLPGLKGEEIAELKEGQKYPYLETDNETGWYKIQYQPPAPGLPNGITGWVSNQYSSIQN